MGFPVDMVDLKVLSVQQPLGTPVKRFWGLRMHLCNIVSPSQMVTKQQKAKPSVLSWR